MKKNDDCEICFKIICKKCGWEANDEETKAVQENRLTVCPVCGWSPGKR